MLLKLWNLLCINIALLVCVFMYSFFDYVCRNAVIGVVCAIVPIIVNWVTVGLITSINNYPAAIPDSVNSTFEWVYPKFWHLRVYVIKIVYRCTSIRPYVHPSTKSFCDLNDIWFIGRGQWRIIKSKVKVKVTISWGLEILLFSNSISFAIYNLSLEVISGTISEYHRVGVLYFVWNLFLVWIRLVIIVLKITVCMNVGPSSLSKFCSDNSYEFFFFSWPVVL